MSEELQELMNNNPEWYKNLLLPDVKSFIKANIESTSRSFIAIGYYLKYVRDNELFKEDGYSGILEFAQSEFGISKSWASKWMSINDQFSVSGNSPILLEQYKDFSSSKLSEMLYLSDEQREQVTITTTVAEIREIKIPAPVIDKSFSISKTEEATKPQLSRCLHKAGTECNIVNAKEVAADLGVNCNGKCCWGCKENLCGAMCNVAAHNKPVVNLRHDENPTEIVTESVNTEPEYIETVTNEEEYDTDDVPCRSCKYDTMNPDEYLTNHPGATLPCIACDDKFESWRPKDFKEEAKVEDKQGSVETVEADIIPTEPEKAPEYSPKYFLEEQKRKLNEMMVVDGVPRIIIERQKTIVCALASMVCDLENVVPEKHKPTQPELPILKNNDQRTEWLKNYQAWGIWYKDENINVTYYRFNFSDSSYLVVDEYTSWDIYNRKERTSAYYHLIGKVLNSQGDKSRYSHYDNSLTELVEHLKNIQKKGGTNE